MKSVKFEPSKFQLTKTNKGGGGVSGNALISFVRSENHGVKTLLLELRVGYCVEIMSLSSGDYCRTSQVKEIVNVVYNKAGRALSATFTTVTGSEYTLTVW